VLDGIRRVIRIATPVGALGTISAWRPVLLRPATGRARWAPRVLRLLRPRSHLRTLIRSERQMRVLVVRTSILRETVLRRGPGAPRSATPSAPVARTSVQQVPVTNRLVVLRRTLVPQGSRTHLRVVRPVLRHSVERTRTVEHRRIERRPGRAGFPPSGVGSGVEAQRHRQPTVRRAAADRPAPVAPVEPIAGHLSDDPARPPTTATLAPPAPAPVTLPDLDELVDRVIRRIERRAIAQRERLGRY
jgi:hypothetical protein